MSHHAKSLVAAREKRAEAECVGDLICSSSSTVTRPRPLSCGGVKRGGGWPPPPPVCSEQVLPPRPASRPAAPPPPLPPPAAPPPASPPRSARVRGRPR